MIRYGILQSLHDDPNTFLNFDDLFWQRSSLHLGNGACLVNDIDRCTATRKFYIQTVPSVVREAMRQYGEKVGCAMNVQ